MLLQILFLGALQYFIGAVDVESYWLRFDGSLDEDNADVVVDRNGNMIFSGHYCSNAATLFDPTNRPVAEAPLPENMCGLAVAKYYQNGSFAWVVRFSGSDVIFNGQIATDVSDNVIVCGQFYANPMRIYDSKGSQVRSMSPMGGWDNAGLIAKFTSGGDFVFASRVDGFSGDGINGCGVDNLGNIVAIGAFSSTTLYFYDPQDNFIGTLSNAGGTWSTFVTKYSPTGTYRWAVRIDGSSIDFTSTKGVAIDRNNSILTSGYYSSSTLTISHVGGSATLPRNKWTRVERCESCWIWRIVYF